MNLRKYIPFLSSNDTKESDSESRVIEGEGPKRVLVNESLNDDSGE
jgi:hypothetical protein